MPRPTGFKMTLGIPSTPAADAADELTIQDVYAALVHDEARNALILADLVHALAAGRTPLLLSNRTEHLQLLATQLSQAAEIANVITQVFVMRGGMGRKQRQAVAQALAAVSEDESRVILATGSYIGEGFDDARLDTLFLAMPISWKGTLQQDVGRLHRLHDNKRVVQVYDYADSYVPMLARMYERRVRGYTSIGYVVEEASPVSPQPAATADT